MYFKYGDYKHADNTVTLSSFSQVVSYDDRGNKEKVTKTMLLDGVLIESNQADMKTAIKNLETAYLKDVFVAGLYHDGTPAVQSPHTLTRGTSDTGIRVLSLNYPKGDGAEYATQRTFRISLQTEDTSPEGVAEVELKEFSEQLSFVGDGGSSSIAINVLDGPPVIQYISQQTHQRITQSGRAVNRYNNYPEPPSPIFPSYVIGPSTSITRISPKFDRSRLTDWGVTWSYTSIHATAQIGSPHTGSG